MDYLKFKSQDGNVFVSPMSSIAKIDISENGNYRAWFIKTATETHGKRYAEIISDVPEGVRNLL